MPQSAAHPLGPPSVSNTLITVDTMLANPTRVTRFIQDLTLQRFIADRIFSSAGGVTGGAVIYDQATTNELYSNRDVEKVAPGNEFPIVGAERLNPQVAEVEKWGGKVYITDEAKQRNDTALFTREITRLANTIVRKVNQRAIEVLAAAISASGQSAANAGNWSTVVLDGNSPTAPSARPSADFANTQLAADLQELGVVYDLWLVNPQELAALRIAYGDKLPALLADYGITMYASNRVTAGKAYAIASGQVGEMRLEQPLTTETWREEKTERTWVQSSVRPVMYVTDPFAAREITGLAS